MATSVCMCLCVRAWWRRLDIVTDHQKQVLTKKGASKSACFYFKIFNPGLIPREKKIQPEWK